MERVDVAVVGAGIVGLSAAWRLAEAGQDVVVLEQFDLGHDHGSSHGATRIFRFAYDDPVYVHLAQEALPLWRELESATGRSVLHITGGIDIGDPTYLEACNAALRACGARAQHLGPIARRDRFPWLSLGEEGCIFSPDTGVIAANDAIQAVAAAARAAGARVLDASPVERLEVRDDEVAIVAGEHEMRAGHCVVATGAWVEGLLEPLGIALPVRVTREQVLYFRSDDPVVPFIHRAEIARYGVPAFGSASGVKIAEHGTGAPTTADGRSFESDLEGRARVIAYVRDALPTFDPEPVAIETCLYTMSPDEGFILDARGPIVIASTCSGHGFKFAPIVGELIARIVTNREQPVSLAPFSMERFA
jgi:sarcosine oxidase